MGPSDYMQNTGSAAFSWRGSGGFTSFSKDLEEPEPTMKVDETRTFSSNAWYGPLQNGHPVRRWTCSKDTVCLHLGFPPAVLRGHFPIMEGCQAHFSLTTSGFCPPNDPASSPTLVTSFGSK